MTIARTGHSVLVTLQSPVKTPASVSTLVTTSCPIPMSIRMTIAPITASKPTCPLLSSLKDAICSLILVSTSMLIVIFYLYLKYEDI